MESFSVANVCEGVLVSGRTGGMPFGNGSKLWRIKEQ